MDDVSASVPAAEPTPPPVFSLSVRRPNVLVVTVDDLATIDMPYLPRVRRLMQKGGVAFADALAPTPLCAPSRAPCSAGSTPTTTAPSRSTARAAGTPR